MFSRMSKPSTPTLPLYNTPRSQAPQLPGRYNARYMMVAVFCFLSLAVFYTFGRAAPIIVRPQELDVTDAVNEAIKFHNNIEAMTDIYRGTEDTASLDNLNHLIIVTGHAILLDKANYQNDEAWILEPFQKGGQIHTFVDHILKGIELAKADDKSLLMFSGGQTRPLAGPRSESQSYWDLANHIHRNDPSMEKLLLRRVASEEFARDSYENLLFSLCRFFEITGRYPDAITVIGFGFKERRFRELHRRAIRFPHDRFAYVGIDPPGADIQELKRLEDANAASHFQADPYACSSPVLAGKRLQRNPFRRMHGYGKTNTALLDLLSWCPEQGSRDIWFNKSLPWERNEL